MLVRIIASAINPADLLIFENRYPGPDTLPAPVGIEGAGEVVAVGESVDTLAVGDHVISLGRANWADLVCGDARQFVRIPSALDWQQAAQLKANPPSAHLMLTQYQSLQPGDWVIQNAANSGVGRHVIRFCRARGLHSVNLVRRASLINELTDIGADIVLVNTGDNGDTAEQVRRLAGENAGIRLGLDAIGGQATATLADCLSDNGTIVNYGFISGEPCRFTPYHTIIHNLTLRGFWLVGYMRSNDYEQIAEMYQEMAKAFMDGVLSVPVEAEYALEDIGAALAHAAAENRSGKILLRPG